MSVRTTSQLVEGILLTNYDSKRVPSLQPFIDTATTVVDRLVIFARSKGLLLTATELELIERWLSAHFYGIADQFYQSKKTLDSEGVFQGKTAMMLDATLYGQQALLLDWTNSLDQLQKQVRVRAFWMGKVPLDQTDSDNRSTRETLIVS
jgi:hypothetical protein